MLNSTGPRIDPCGTPERISRMSLKVPFMFMSLMHNRLLITDFLYQKQSLETFMHFNSPLKIDSLADLLQTDILGLSLMNCLVRP